jgi:cob(I)alamin adenosyltransferase
MNTPDIPKDQSCQEVNPALFRYFQLKLFKLTGNLATPNWSEAEVVQWLDTEVDKYEYDALVKNTW